MSAERERIPEDDRPDLEERDETMSGETSRDDALEPGREETPKAPSMGEAMDGTEAPAPPSREPLLPGDRSRSYRERWEQIQGKFVDEPQSSVEEADRLVLDVIQQLQSSFTSEREALESQWQRGGDVETEQLRVALQRYRSFFDRLLAA